MTSEEKKLLSKMYDKKGNLTPLGEKVMAHGRNEITLNISDLELNVLQIAILHMIELCTDETEQEQDEVWAERLTAAENLRLALNVQTHALKFQTDNEVRQREK